MQTTIPENLKQLISIVNPSNKDIENLKTFITRFPDVKNRRSWKSKPFNTYLLCNS